MNRSVKITAVAVSVVTSACHRAGPIETSSTTEPAAATKSESGRIVRRNSWTIIPATDIHRYIVTQVASTQTIQPSNPTSDSLKLTAQFSLTINRQGELTRFNAIIERFSAQQSQRSGQFNPQLPLSLNGRIESSKISLDPASASTPEPNCTNGNLTLLIPVKAAVLSTPFNLTVGMSWIDSVSLPGCAGSITTTTSRRSTYRVIGDTTVSGSDAILLELTEMSTARGDGSEGQHSVQVTAAGSGTGRVTIDATTGRVLKSTAIRTTELSIRASGRIHRFRQTSNEEAAWQGSN